MQMPFSKCSGGPLAWLKCNTVPTPNASEHPLHCPKSRPYTKGARWADGELSEGDARHRPHRRVLVMDSDPWAVHLPRAGQPALECGEEHFKDVVALLAVLGLQSMARVSRLLLHFSTSGVVTMPTERGASGRR